MSEKEIAKFLNLDEYGICLKFQGSEFATKSCQHIFLDSTSSGQLLGTIDYIEDNTIGIHASLEFPPNAIGIVRKDYDSYYKIFLKMYNRHTIELEIKDTYVTVRYPADVPVRLLLDDVLQAALQPILEKNDAFILHGSCMVYHKAAIVFMGNSGAGKSTTAFNLIRFGFNCYADDAVLVYPKGSRLYVAPMAREFSIRPLSFSLLHQYGIQTDNYIKEGEKYYFSQGLEQPPSALLKHLCFVMISGDKQTKITGLTRRQTLETLSLENRHFSFMGRSNAERYSKILSQKVEKHLSAQVGTDLDYQGNMFKDLIQKKKVNQLPKRRTTKTSTAREQKRSLIISAFSANNTENLAELIPLLAHYDLNLLTLALGFFQSYPLAKISSLKSNLGIDKITDRKLGPSWLRAQDWVKGCEKLIQDTGVEVIQNFAFPWIKSAPILYPFLKMCAADNLKKLDPIENAWQRYTKEILRLKNSKNGGVAIHFSNTMDPGKWSNTVFREWFTSITAKYKVSRIYYWIASGDEFTNHESLDLLNIMDTVKYLTVVAVDSGMTNFFKAALDFFRWASAHGLKPELSRSIPLCKLSKTDSDYLLGFDGFETWPQIKKRGSFFYLGNKVVNGKLQECVYPQDWLGIDRHIIWQDNPYEDCRACGLFPLGICPKGVYKVKSEMAK